MRVLLTVAHYYQHRPESVYGSSHTDAATRAAAVSRSLRSWREQFVARPNLRGLWTAHESVANQSTGVQLDLVAVTNGSDHLLDRVALDAGCFRHEATKAPAMELGFECQRILCDSLNQYDLFGFLEDDLIVHDPWFLAKLEWFRASTDPLALLMPHRYEAAQDRSPEKVYIDAAIARRFTQRFHDISVKPQIVLPYLNGAVSFRRPINPHSGCYFLSREQLTHWAEQPYFLDRDASFVGPLESAATLGVMRTFRLYKPAPRCANFLEIEHAGDIWIRRFREAAGLEPSRATAPVAPCIDSGTVR